MSRRSSGPRAALFSLAVAAGSGLSCDVAKPPKAQLAASDITPPCRLVPIDEVRFRAALARAKDRLAGCRGLDTSFANRVLINPATADARSGADLVIEIVQDATATQAPKGCLVPGAQGRPGESKDPVSVSGLCVSQPGAPGRAPRIRCSAGALARILGHSTTERWDIPLVYVLAHELSHVAHGHARGAFLPAPATVSLMRPLADRISGVGNLCNEIAKEDPRGPRQQEIEADADALWVVRIELDDVGAAGPGCHVPTARGGVGEHPHDDLTGAPDELPPKRIPRGRLGSASALMEQFRALAEDLAEWESTFGSKSVIPAELTEPPLAAPDRLSADRAAGNILCRLVEETPRDARFHLPTLPGVTHPDGSYRLSQVSHAIDRIANDQAGVSAVIDRQVATWMTDLVDPMCRKARDAEKTVLAGGNAATACAAFHAPPPATVVCKPFQSALEDELLPPGTLVVKATATQKNGATVWELDQKVQVAASLGSSGVVLGTGDVFGDHTAVGVLSSGMNSVSLFPLPCTPTALAVSPTSSTLFCHEPLAVVPLGKDGRPQGVRRLRRVVLDGGRVDGFQQGALDRNGQPEDQSMYTNTTPVVPAQLDRHDVSLMRQARFSWAGVVDGRTLAALDFPGGGSSAVAQHDSLGVTVEYAGDKLSPLPWSSAVPWCTSLTSSMIVESGGGSWRGMLQESPLWVVMMDASGAVQSTFRPRALPSGGLSELDVPRCTFSSAHRKLLCVDELGSLFEGGDPMRTRVATLPMDPGEVTVRLCSTSKKVFLLARSADPTGGKYSLYSVGVDTPATLVHRDDYERGELTCNAQGAAAALATMSRGDIVHVPD